MTVGKSRPDNAPHNALFSKFKLHYVGSCQKMFKGFCRVRS